MKKLTPFWTVMISIILLSIVINLLLSIISINEIVQLEVGYIPSLYNLDN